MQRIEAATFCVRHDFWSIFGVLNLHIVSGGLNSVFDGIYNFAVAYLWCNWRCMNLFIGDLSQLLEGIRLKIPNRYSRVLPKKGGVKWVRCSCITLNHRDCVSVGP